MDSKSNETELLDENEIFDEYQKKDPILIQSLLEDAIKSNPSIGLLENQSFLMNVASNNNIFIPFKIFVYITLFLSIFITALPKVYLWIFGVILLIPFSISLFLLLLAFCCCHYLVYNIKEDKFYTITKLFDTFVIGLLTTDPVDASNIRKIILYTNFHRGRNSNIGDKILVGLDNNEEIDLTSPMNPIIYHRISQERCLLLARCLNIDFITRANPKDLEKLENTLNSNGFFDKLNRDNDTFGNIIKAGIIIVIIALLIFLFFEIVGLLRPLILK